MKLSQGSIVEASVLDPQGRNRKTRPVVVITTDAEIAAGIVLTGVCVTGTPELSDPSESVELPWHPARHPMTGLMKRSAAVCNWVVTLGQTDVLQIRGRCPGRKLGEILAKVNARDPQ